MSFMCGIVRVPNYLPSVIKKTVPFLVAELGPCMVVTVRVVLGCAAILVSQSALCVPRVVHNKR